MEDKLLTHPFDALYREDSRVLILGSFPSVVSRQQNFYYANATNRFWPVMEEVFEDSAEDRIAFCYRHHIALWDVINACTIHASSDASIANVRVNNIDALVKKTEVRAIFTTGRKASDLFEKYVKTDMRHIALPSTSAANARMKKADLVLYYRMIRDYAEKD